MSYRDRYRSAPAPIQGMPPGIPYIVGNEAAERYSYYGMRAILVIFMTKFLMNANGELDLIAGHTLDAGTDLEADHPGFNDPDYRARRAHIDQLARAYRHGDEFPRVGYTQQEIDDHLDGLFARYKEYFLATTEQCGYTITLGQLGRVSVQEGTRFAFSSIIVVLR